MATKSISTLPLKRKKKGQTNYRKRLKLLLSQQHRFVVRKSLRHITVQVIAYHPSGDHILVSAHSSELKQYGWTFQADTLPAVYLTGFLAGRKAHQQKVASAILDIGLYTSKQGSRIFAAVKGAIDAGLIVPCQDDMFPSPERIRGEHIKQYASMSSAHKGTQFKHYFEQGKDPSAIDAIFEQTKKKIRDSL